LVEFGKALAGREREWVCATAAAMK